MYINSPGGVVTSGLSIYDTMQYIKPKVSTPCCRAGPRPWGRLLLAAGRKGDAFPRCPIRVSWSTSPPAAFRAQATDISIHAREILELKERSEQDLCPSHRPNLEKGPRMRWNVTTFMTAEMAKDWGLIDDIVTPLAPTLPGLDAAKLKHQGQCSFALSLPPGLDLGFVIRRSENGPPDGETLSQTRPQR